MEDLFGGLADFKFILFVVTFLLESDLQEVAEMLGFEGLEDFSMLLAALSGCDLLGSSPKRNWLSTLPPSVKFANLLVLTCKILCFSTWHARDYNSH